MQTTPMKLVTIIAEDEIEPRLTRDIMTLGAHGYSVGKVRGEGLHGARLSEWEGENIRLETIVSEEVADKIMARLAEQYFPHFAIIAYLSNIEVLRGGKFI
jgi:nitrogen regulatory protein P-II 2